MESSKQMHHLTFKDLLDKSSSGEMCPCFAIEVRNMAGTQSWTKSWAKVCEELAQKHKVDPVKLFTIVFQKVNNDTIVRLGRSPIFKTQVMKVMDDRGYDTEQIDPEDVFECPSDYYDVSEFKREQEAKQELDTLLKALERSIDDTEDTDIFHNQLTDLQDSYHGCEERMNNQLQVLENHCSTYEPKYNPVLYDLARIPRSEYFEMIDKDTEVSTSGGMNRIIHKNVDKIVPERPEVVMLTLILLRDIIIKEHEKYKRIMREMLDDTRAKKEAVNVILGRIPKPGQGWLAGLAAQLGSALSIEGILSSDDETDNETDNEEKELMETLGTLVGEQEREQLPESLPSPEMAEAQEKLDTTDDGGDDDDGDGAAVSSDNTSAKNTSEENANETGTTFELNLEGGGAGASFF